MSTWRVEDARDSDQLCDGIVKQDTIRDGGRDICLLVLAN